MFKKKQVFEKTKKKKKKTIWPLYFLLGWEDKPQELNAD